MTEEDVKYLSKLKYESPEKFERKCKILGISGDGIPRYVSPSPASSKGYTMGGKPYAGTPPPGFMARPVQTVKQEQLEKTVVFIDAENISPDRYRTLRRKIRKKYKNIEERAYAVEKGPAADSWEVDGIRPTKVPGSPKKNKADNQIKKEVRDSKADHKIVISKDKGFDELKDIKGYERRS